MKKDALSKLNGNKKENEIGSIFLKKTEDFLIRKIHFAVLILFLVGFLGCLFVSEKYIKNPSWSKEEKEAYIKSKTNAIIFDRKSLDSIVKEKNFRQDEYKKNISSIKDIYGLNSK